MKRYLAILIAFIGVILIPKEVFAEEVHLYLFYGNTCPICERERAYLETVRENYPDVKIFEYETYQNIENKEAMIELKEMYNFKN